MAVNPYLIPGSDCLQNKLGFSDKALLDEAEKKITSARLAELEANPISGNLDYEHLKAIHRHLFTELYEWAGKERTVQTIKGVSRFEWPERIQPEAQALFGELKNENYLLNVDRPQFIERAAHYFGELNVIHPFPEGNGRAQRVLFDNIARQAGFEFNWSLTTKDKLIEAVVHAYAVDTSSLEAVFDHALSYPERTIHRDLEFSSDGMTIASPIEKSEYDNAVTFLNAQQRKIEKELYPDATSDPMQDETRMRAINRELKKHFPDATATKVTYEANQQIEALFAQWRSLDTDIAQAEQGSDDEQINQLLNQKMRLLEKLTYRKNLVERLSPGQKKHIKHDYDCLENTLSHHRSRDLGRDL